MRATWAFAAAACLCVRTAAAATWTPQEDSPPRANRTWTERIADELDRSLLAYARPRSANGVENLVLRLMSDPLRSVLVLGRYVVVDQRMFVRPNQMHKGILHMEFLRALMEKRPSGNVVYQWEWNADGFKSQDQLIRDGCPAPKRMGSGKQAVKDKSWASSKANRRTVLPRLVIAKRYGYDQCGILVPNCYFESVDDWEATTAAIARSRAARQEQKDPRVFWRGAIRNQGKCADESGNFARAEAVALSARHPNLFDVKCIDCTVRDDVKEPCAEFTFDAATREALKDTSKISGAYVAREDFGKYQYQLNLPGSVSGSYSRNLNHLWLLGSVVAMWDAPYVEFYYPALAEGETHVAFDRTTASAALAAVTPELRRALLANAKKVAEELLCPDCLANYWRLVVAKLREYFRFDLVLDDPKRLKRVLDRFDLEGRQLVAFHSSHKGTAVHFLTAKNQLMHVAMAALDEAREPPPRVPTNGGWNPLPRRHFQKVLAEARLVRQKRDSLLRTYVPDGLRVKIPSPFARSRSFRVSSAATPVARTASTKLAQNKKTGVLETRVASAKREAGVDDDGQYWMFNAPE